MLLITLLVLVRSAADTYTEAGTDTYTAGWPMRINVQKS